MFYSMQRYKMFFCCAIFYKNKETHIFMRLLTELFD